MSLLRFAVPGRPTVVVDLGPAVGRQTWARYGVKGGTIYGAMAVGESSRDRDLRLAREWKVSHPNSKFVDDRVRKNPDNGGVQDSTTEVHL